MSCFFQAEDGIRDWSVTGVQTCALPISDTGGLLQYPREDQAQAFPGGHDGRRKDHRRPPARQAPRQGVLRCRPRDRSANRRARCRHLRHRKRGRFSKARGRGDRAADCNERHRPRYRGRRGARSPQPRASQPARLRHLPSRASAGAVATHPRRQIQTAAAGRRPARAAGGALRRARSAIPGGRGPGDRDRPPRYRRAACAAACPMRRSMQTLRVALGERSYPIHVGTGLLDGVDLVAPFLAQGKVAVVTNTTVAPLYPERVARLLAREDVVRIVVADGEEHKDWSALNGIFDALLEQRCGRDTVLIALGGGVIGDLAGFAAATYLRGVPFVQIPTTLLAQVDSSVGGKTAINHPLGKNMIGAFHQPELVVADMRTLETLPGRELRSGLAEVIKHGLIRDAAFFDWIEANIDRLLARDPDALEHAVVRSIAIKAEIVGEDERERGVRALLNFGHTFGHAIETGLGYGPWLHCEAVAAGMVMAAGLSRQLGLLSEADTARIRSLLERAGLPTAAKGITPARMQQLMRVDKKAKGGRIHFVLLERLGAALQRADIPAGAIDQTLSRLAA